jgi:RimJ/RimL family protein N-acetyltransferase
MLSAYCHGAQSFARLVSGLAGELVGLCGVVNVRGNSDGEIWYLINPESWGKGIATEALEIRLGYSNWLLNRFEPVTYSAHGANEAWPLGVKLQFLPQVRNVHI